MNTKRKSRLDSLGNDSLLLQKRNEADVKVHVRFSQMDRSQKIKFLKDYYTVPLIITLVILAFIFFLLYHDVWNKENISLRCAIMDQKFSMKTTDELSKSFTDYLKLDQDKNKSIFTQYDTTVKSTTADKQSGADTDNSTLLRTLSDRIGAGQLDVMIANEGVFINYLLTRTYYRMDAVFTKEELEKLKDVLYVPDLKENGKNLAYGIYLDKRPVYQKLFKDNKCTVEKPILAIINNTKKKETSRQFVFFLFPNLFEKK